MKILAFGAHADDIEIGMGGTVAKYVKNKHNVLMIITTIPKQKEIRINEAKEAAKILGANLFFLDVNPSDIGNQRKLVETYDKIINNENPDVIFTHWNHDAHNDHKSVTNAILASTRKNTCSVYMYEQTIPGGIVPYGFKAQMFIDISNEIDKKIESINAHKSQLASNGEWWLQGLKGRAMYRGYQINTKYAETFEVVKEIKKNLIF